MTFIVKQTKIDELASTAPPYLREMLENFSVSAHQHAKDLNDHKQHMGLVDQQKNLPKEERTHQSYPAPMAPNLIDQAVQRREDGVFVADFQIVNDRPSTEQLAAKRLREKKVALITKVSEVEADLIKKVSGGYKHRAFQFRYGDIARADNGRASAIVAKLGKGVTHQEIKAQIEADRPADDTKFKVEHEARLLAAEGILRHAAELHSQIDDLTPQNVDAWTMAPFPDV